MAKKTLIMGKHPLAASLMQQYKTKGWCVDNKQTLTADGISINEYNELCILADDGEDDIAVAMLEQLAADYDLASHEDKRLICHLMVQSANILQMMQTCDFCDSVKQKIDVYPFTLDEAWSRSIVLDYEPITAQSEKYVHLVVFGMDDIAKTVAIQAAHVAHFPNYISNHSLRTRITMIDEDAEKKCDGFTKRYQHLFDNSYYRIVKPSEEKAIVKFHKPMYDGKREDFVDVEWEFVEANISNADLRGKLQLWSKSDNQLLTVVMAYQDESKNVSQALFLPNDIFLHSIPVHIYNRQHNKYSIELPLVCMAKNINYIYDQCYSENIEDWKGTLRYTVEIDIEKRERLWNKLSNLKRMSNIYNAMTIPSKMRSIGLKEDDWDKFYGISQQDIEMLAQVEHNRWSVEELILGFRPCTDEEQRIIAADVANQKTAYKERKIHYDLRAYNDLRPDKTGRSVQIYDLCLSSCLPLIAKSYIEEKGGEV